MTSLIFTSYVSFSQIKILISRTEGSLKSLLDSKSGCFPNFAKNDFVFVFVSAITWFSCRETLAEGQFLFMHM